MIVVYHAGGAGDFDLDAPSSGSTEHWERLRSNAARLLLKRNKQRAASLLTSIPFQVSEATNHFADEFSVLHATVPLEQYHDVGAMKAEGDYADAFAEIAAVVSEVGGPFIRFIAVYLALEEHVSPVDQPEPQITSEVVERALMDAEHLLRTSGPLSAVDRAHTALHGYLRAACQTLAVPPASDATLPELFKLLRVQHPAFAVASPRGDDVRRILNAISTVLDALNPLRNRGSVAHPNEVLLHHADAMLAINCARTILRYLDDKLSAPTAQHHEDPL